MSAVASVVCGGPACPRTAPATKQCARCKAIWYCSVECQKAHWSIHKSRCLSGRVAPVAAVSFGDRVRAKLVETAHRYLKLREDEAGMRYPDSYAVQLKAQGRVFPKEWVEGHADERYFRRTGPYTFELKRGARASEALVAFLEGLTICDCACATAAIYYKAILDTLGAEKFDRIFQKMVISGDGIGAAAEAPYSGKKVMYEGLFDFKPVAKEAARATRDGRDPFDPNIHRAIGKRRLEVGDECFFHGIKCYPNKHPQGSGAGFNAIYVGDNQEGAQLFMALGFTKPLTELEIYQLLIVEYDEERSGLDEDYIAQAGTPDVHSREENTWMKHYYTLPQRYLDGFTQNPVQFLDFWTLNQHGFEPKSVRGINYEKLQSL